MFKTFNKTITKTSIRSKSKPEDENDSKVDEAFSKAEDAFKAAEEAFSNIDFDSNDVYTMETEEFVVKVKDGNISIKGEPKGLKLNGKELL